ncbi:MAG: AraC family transcriptional regulator, partial [Oscillospiraceae bacterium]|nr:AraC family transcriptional regulator [Oscillospiraceae bacterium]
MIDWVEAHLTENPSLLEMSNQIGYSPYYCSSHFHEIAGTTFKRYVAGRRLAMAALEIRDTDARILDIAIKYGYSSQEALTRAFMSAFGCTPAIYR